MRAFYSGRSHEMGLELGMTALPRSLWRLASCRAPASWSAVTEMHGASLHRRHRFRGVKEVLWTHYFIRPAKAAALSRGIECYAAPARRPACESGAALKLVTALQDASRSRKRWAYCRAPSPAAEFEPASRKEFDCMVTAQAAVTNFALNFTIAFWISGSL